MITHVFDLDMTPGGVRAEQRLNQYDSDFTLRIHLISSKGEFSIESGTTAEIRGTKPDGNVFSAAATVDAANAIVTVTGDEQMTPIAGRAVFEITLKHNGNELSSKNFYLHIERAAMDRDTIRSDSKIRELADMTDDVDAILAAGRSAVTAAEEAEETKQEVEEIVAGFDPISEFEKIGLTIVDGALCWIAS